MEGGDAEALLETMATIRNLDAVTGERVADLLFSLNEGSGTTLLLVTHDERLGARCERTLVIVESLYSMLGDVAPLGQFCEVVRRHGAFLLLDDAHSFGIMGETGRGLAEALGIEDEIDFVTGTFSKSLGSVGGFFASRKHDVAPLRSQIRAYMFTASSSPATIATSLEALRRLAESGSNPVVMTGFAFGNVLAEVAPETYFEAMEPWVTRRGRAEMTMPNDEFIVRGWVIACEKSGRSPVPILADVVTNLLMEDAGEDVVEGVRDFLSSSAVRTGAAS